MYVPIPFALQTCCSCTASLNFFTCAGRIGSPQRRQEGGQRRAAGGGRRVVGGGWWAVGGGWARAACGERRQAQAASGEHYRSSADLDRRSAVPWRRPGPDVGGGRGGQNKPMKCVDIITGQVLSPPRPVPGRRVSTLSRLDL